MSAFSDRDDDFPFRSLLEDHLSTSHAAPYVPPHPGSVASTSLPGPVDPRAMQGSSALDVLFWDGKQSYADTCAIRCQEFLLQQFTGIDIPEDQLIYEAAQRGWYAPGSGTSPADVGRLLELHGVPVNRFEHSNIYHLTNELAQGHKVIIGVDSGELWEGNSILESIADSLGLDGADHAVVVSGIDTSDPQHPQVIISDPGTGAAAARYPLEQFLDAWADSGFFMVSTAAPAPAHLPEMRNFDYARGHLASVLGVPFEDFHDFAAHPQDWAHHVDEYLGASTESADVPQDVHAPDGGESAQELHSPTLSDAALESAERVLSNVFHLPVDHLFGNGE